MLMMLVSFLKVKMIMLGTGFALTTPVEKHVMPSISPQYFLKDSSQGQGTHTCVLCGHPFMISSYRILNVLSPMVCISPTSPHRFGFQHSVISIIGREDIRPTCWGRFYLRGNTQRLDRFI
uniref:Secreted protein n=1 Tax=Eutreptiella gymnastica TaxID=73025 RepID=A0A7S1JIM8_9EUGL|mmetsp:Transcript_99494/g.171270  ORF Transcript_99494/g.171270 Transcript_99494/m.171270 type:complete len:121 (+) Transcript_99494:1-363(+)